DLGGQADAWARLQWHSLTRVRAAWPRDRLVLPAHYPGERERRADRAVAARLDVIAGSHAGCADRHEATSIQRRPGRTPPPPESVKIRIPDSSSIEIGTTAPGCMTMCAKLQPVSMPGRLRTVWRRKSSAVVGSLVRRR